MLKMKKILSILLMLIFVTSVTAAAASAHEDKYVGHKDVKKVVVIEKKFNHHNKFDNHKRHQEFNRGHWVPGHYETKIVKKVVYRHHQKIVIKQITKVWVPGHWVQTHHRW